MDVEKLIERLGSVKRGQSYADAIYDAYGQLPRFQLYDDLEEAAAALAKLQADLNEAREALRDVEDELCDRFLRPDSAERARCSRCGGEAFSPEGISHRTGCVVGRVQAASRALGGGG